MRYFSIVFVLLLTNHIVFGACLGVYRGEWTNATNYTSLNTSKEYYKIDVAKDTTLSFALENSSSGWRGKKNISFKLYPDESCSGSPIFSQILNRNESVIKEIEASSSKTYILQIEKDNSSYKYRWSATIQDYSLSTNGRTFKIRNPIETQNIKGNMKVIGNTVLCYKKNGKCADTNSANNHISLSFINTNGVNYKYKNSSQALISDIPNTAKILWAGFYTQGYLKTTESKTVAMLTETPSYLITPQNETIALKTDVIDIYPYKKSEHTYSTFTEVSALKGLSGSEVNGWFTGANIKALEGKDSGNLGYFGAWSLVIVYEDESESLKNISVFDGYKEIGSSNDTIKISGFYTPTSGDVRSTLSVFVGEGDKNIVGDDITLNGKSLSGSSGKKNAFNSTINGFETNPDPINYQGIDIHNYEVGKDGDESHPQIIGNGAKEATVGLITTGDYYYPSVVGFTTELYEPRVCYKQEFFNELGEPIDEIKVGDILTVHTWISNMKKDSQDVNLETADKVEITVEIDSQNLEYIPNSIKIKNINELGFSDKTDEIKDDIADFLFDTNTTKWRLGVGSNETQGGEFTPNFNELDEQKAFVEFQVKLLQEGDIDIDNIYKVSYENPQLGLRFGDESPLNIGVCADIETSFDVGGVLGRFNVVNIGGGGGEFNNPSSPQTWLKTQVANRAFDIKVISINDNGTALKNYNGIVELSLIENPYDGSCNNNKICKQQQCESAEPISEQKEIAFSSTQLVTTFAYENAIRAAYFKIKYGSDSDPKYACSVDGFAIRPESFKIEAPVGEDIDLLTSAQAHYFSLKAPRYEEDEPTIGYSVDNIDKSKIELEQIIYRPDGGDGTTELKGSLEYVSSPFGIEDGSANSGIGIKFTDVGMVNIKMIDKEWAKIDIDNGDTDEDCQEYGAWICGDKDASFIPAKFKLSEVKLHNSDSSSFTYLSNDLEISAPISLKVISKNADDDTTENFDKDSWENPLKITIELPTIAGMTPEKNEIDSYKKLGFDSGELTIPWDEADASKQLSFNFKDREVDVALNPFEIEGEDINLTASSRYSTAGNTKDVTGTKKAQDSATFIYGRTHAPRQRYKDDSGEALIYFEAYCFGRDANGVSCDKSLLPNGLNSRNTNDLRWFVNPDHNANHGVIGNVVEKNTLGRVNPTGQTGINPVTVDMTYNEDQGYPYKTTMENNASSWLIHNQHNPGATTNEFPVEFYREDGAWSGKHETDTTTKDPGVTNTNRRSMW